MHQHYTLSCDEKSTVFRHAAAIGGRTVADRSHPAHYGAAARGQHVEGAVSSLGYRGVCPQKFSTDILRFAAADGT